jgi:hypothetical protein
MNLVWAGSYRLDWLETALAALAVWRVTHLLQVEDGPWDCFNKLRQHADRKGFSRVFGCHFCISLWVAMPFALMLARDIRQTLLLWLGLSAAAILLGRLGPSADFPPAIWWHENSEEEPGGDRDVMLRK